MTRNLYAAVERNIDRGATKLREENISYRMRERARSMGLTLISAEHEPERKAQQAEASVRESVAILSMFTDRPTVQGLLGQLANQYAPDIDIKDIAKTKAEAAFRKGGA